jgi:hypothetical protein
MGRMCVALFGGAVVLEGILQGPRLHRVYCWRFLGLPQVGWPSTYVRNTVGRHVSYCSSPTTDRVT